MFYPKYCPLCNNIVNINFSEEDGYILKCFNGTFANSKDNWHYLITITEFRVEESFDPGGIAVSNVMYYHTGKDLFYNSVWKYLEENLSFDKKLVHYNKYISTSMAKNFLMLLS